MKVLSIIAITCTLVFSGMAAANSYSGGGKVFGTAMKCQLKNGDIQQLPRELCHMYKGTVINM